jgi:hypothetical protein
MQHVIPASSSIVAALAISGAAPPFEMYRSSGKPYMMPEYLASATLAGRSLSDGTTITTRAGASTTLEDSIARLRPPENHVRFYNRMHLDDVTRWELSRQDEVNDDGIAKLFEVVCRICDSVSIPYVGSLFVVSVWHVCLLPENQYLHK